MQSQLTAFVCALIALACLRADAGVSAPPSTETNAVQTVGAGASDLLVSRVDLPRIESEVAVDSLLAVSAVESPSLPTAPTKVPPAPTGPVNEHTVEPIPAPSAVASGLVALAALAAVRLIRRLKLT